MIPGLETLACQDLAVPMDVMRHVVQVESSFNPYAIGVVGARLVRQPRNLEEAVATAAKLERDGFNFSVGLAQINRYNLAAQGLDSYERAFDACPNLAAGARILAGCRERAGGDWGKAFSCYYSGNFERGFLDGYVQKIHAAMQSVGPIAPEPIAPIRLRGSTRAASAPPDSASLRARRGQGAAPAAATPDTLVIATGRVPAPDGAPPVAQPTGAPFVPRVTGPTGARLDTPIDDASRNPGVRPSGLPDSAFVF